MSFLFNISELWSIFGELWRSKLRYWKPPIMTFLKQFGSKLTCDMIARSRRLPIARTRQSLGPTLRSVSHRGKKERQPEIFSIFSTPPHCYCPSRSLSHPVKKRLSHGVIRYAKTARGWQTSACVTIIFLFYFSRGRGQRIFPREGGHTCGKVFTYDLYHLYDKEVCHKRGTLKVRPSHRLLTCSHFQSV